MFRVLVVGGSWHGSDCTGLARGFRHLGHAVELIGTDNYFPDIARNIPGKVLLRIMSPYLIRQFNLKILEVINCLKPDLVVIFKGNYVTCNTLERIRAKNICLVNFYPDVSISAHGSLDINSFQYYQHIFTTKTFGIKDMKDMLGLDNVSFLPHGFDNLVHRPFDTSIAQSDWHNDVSFIGTWSPHKENTLGGLVKANRELNMKIWGGQWDNNSLMQLHKHIVGRVVTGDFYALAIASSRINLGLLSERREGASSGDQITSRTFHIPASGGFMLHERTDELLEYYKEDKEVACFDSQAELIDKVAFYLSHEELRMKIAKAGYDRCISENSLSKRSAVIIKKFEELKEATL